MPYTKRKRKTYRKRKNYKKRYNQPLNSVTIRKSPLPTTFKTTLRYCDSLKLDSGSGVPAAYVYGANTLYNPYTGGAGGHQPRGWDQLIPMYSHATVIGSKILVQFQNTDASNSAICGVSLRGGNASEGNLTDYIEQSNVSYKMIGDHTGNGRANVTNSFNNDFLGIKNPLASVELRNTSTQNCDEKAYYHIFSGNTDEVNILPVLAQITIEYIVVFTEPQDLIIS